MPGPQDTVLIFDLDNTLIESTIDFLALRHRLIDLLAAHGAAPGPREALVRLALPELVRLGSARDPGLGAQMWQVIEQAEQAGLAGAEPVAHAAEVLHELRRRGYRLGLLTNNARRGAQERLAALGLAEFFDVVATRDDVARLKPAPDGIAYILERLGGAARAYMVGDAWIDAQAAQAAGIPFIGFGPRAASVQERGLPIWRWIADLRELLALPLEGGEPTRGG